MSCYVCFEQCSEKSPCVCKNMYLHPDCLEILRLYHYKECKVCKTEYPSNLDSCESDSEEEDEAVPLCMWWYILPYAMRPPNTDKFSECGEFARGVVFCYSINCIINKLDHFEPWYEPDPVFVWLCFGVYLFVLSLSRCLCMQCYKYGAC